MSGSRALALVLPVSLLAAHSLAQCPAWTTGFAAPSHPAAITTDATIATFAASGGPEVFAAGRTSATSVGVARWTGTGWQDSYSTFVANGSTISGLWSVQGVSGPELIFGVLAPPTTTPITNLFRFDGSTWTPLAQASNIAVTSVTTHDFGAGRRLVIGGYHFLPASEGVVLSFNGASWSSLGYAGDTVNALASFDDGTGSQLYAGAQPFAQRWNGVSWTNCGSVGGGTVGAFEPFQGQLYCGRWSSGGGLSVWNGATWSSVSGPTSARDLEIVDFGAGPRLAVLDSATIRFFDGANFTTPAGTLAAAGTAYHLAVDHSSGSSRVFASGAFTTAGTVACAGLAVTDGATWDTLGRGFDGTVDALVAHDAGSGPSLYAAGAFAAAGYEGRAFRAARWNGTQWTDLGSPGAIATEMYALLSTNLGAGTELYAGGRSVLGSTTRGVVRWNGTAWVGFSPGVGGTVRALARHDAVSGPLLVTGGEFTTSTGFGNRVAAWDGTSWNSLGNGVDATVNALCQFDEGAGPRLFAGGAFLNAEGQPASCIARWDGTAWSAVAGGLTGATINGLYVSALCVFDDGNGEQLYASGSFSSASVANTNGLARWDGSAWSAVPGWSTVHGNSLNVIRALLVHDDGRGPALYVGGAIGSTGAHVARFDGTNWEIVDATRGGAAYALASVDDDGDGYPELFEGGDFVMAGAVASGRIARFAGCPTYAVFCSGDAAPTDHTTTCPCANAGAPGHGCANSANANGAQLTPSGSPRLDTVVLDGSDMPPTALGVFLQHDAQGDHVFHDGVLCAGGNLLRLRTRGANGGAVRFPDTTFAQDATITLAQRGQVVPGSGATRYYSLFYRNAATTFCPPATANVSNGVRVTW